MHVAHRMRISVLRGIDRGTKQAWQMIRKGAPGLWYERKPLGLACFEELVAYLPAPLPFTVQNDRRPEI